MTVDRLEIAMHRGTRLVTLADVISLVPANAGTWHVLEFEGIGIPPGDLMMQDFEALTRSQGYSTDWQSFRRFARDTEQTSNCLIVALDPTDGRDRRQIIESECKGAHLVVEAFDSTTWTIRSADLLSLERLLDG